MIKSKESSLHTRKKQIESSSTTQSFMAGFQLGRVRAEQRQRYAVSGQCVTSQYVGSLRYFNTVSVTELNLM